MEKMKTVLSVKEESLRKLKQDLRSQHQGEESCKSVCSESAQHVAEGFTIGFEPIISLHSPHNSKLNWVGIEANISHECYNSSSDSVFERGPQIYQRLDPVTIGNVLLFVLRLVLTGKELHARLTNPRGTMIQSSILLEKTKLEEEVKRLRLRITELER